MMKLLIIGMGGFVGALLRYGVSGWVQNRAGGGFPLGTLAVNVAGCLAIGALMAWVDLGRSLSPTARSFLLIGLLGSFTTFSTFGYEAMALARDRETSWFLLYVGGNLLIGLTAVELGRAAIKLLFA